MNTNIEKEYKVLLTEEQFLTLLQNYPNLDFIKQVNTYYDNDSCAIQAIRGVMRIREKENSHLFTMKLRRGEDLYEYECLVDQNAVDVFDTEQIKTLLDEYNLHGPFHQTAQLTTYRAMVISEDAELCFDVSEYNGIRDYEIEYEYKRNHDGLAIFQKILEPIHITYKENCPSKIQRVLGSASVNKN